MIDSYSFGSIVIDGKQYTGDLKIIAGRVIPDWWRKDGHSICEADVTDLIAAPTEKAVQTYNELCQTKNVAVGFHLTC